MSESDEIILEHIIQRMRTDQSVDAPDAALQYARDLYRARLMHPKKGPFRRLVATLAADLRNGVPAFGERSTEVATARQLLFEAEENAIDLRISVGQSGFDLRGQVLGDGFAVGEVEIVGPGIRAETVLHDFSTFTFMSLPAGEYNLLIKGKTVVISLVSLNLQ
jgi:hypothetical protein